MIKVIAVGKIALHLKEAQEYYINRLKKLTDIKTIEVKKQRTKEDEGKLLLSKIRGFTVTLDERGKELTSIEFAKLLQRHRHISFVIGGADGLSENVKKEADMLLSLSKLTLQHDIARIVLLEQIYRGFQIIKGTPYHRE
ncbi:23S rRNA (pseudouridine(1915)-N(3))-methyltransferase RlmH [Desulfurobacterium sp.]